MAQWVKLLAAKPGHLSLIPTRNWYGRRRTLSRSSVQELEALALGSLNSNCFMG